MGGEFGQLAEWNHDASLDWQLLDRPLHRALAQWIGDLNRVLRERTSLHSLDFDSSGFEWVDPADAEQSVLSYVRRGRDGGYLLIVCNFTPLPRYNYRLGVPVGGHWEEILNSDAPIYGGSGQGNLGAVEAAPVPAHERYQSLALTLPPLAVIVLAPRAADAAE
jgi:1,4-alpha-glucan branching enzyme